jgi:sterol 3beta-glucosyltransferase
MKIALLCLGTRGDVQPYAILAKAFKAAGHEVVVSSAKNFESLVRAYGVDFIPVEADYQGLLDSDEGKRMMKNPLRARRHLKSLIFPMMSSSLGTFYEIARDQDKVLFHVKTMAHQFADQFPGKMIRANVVPAIEPTKEFINPVMSAVPLPSFMHKMTYWISEAGLNMWKKPVRDFRAKYGLEGMASRIAMPSIYGISSHFLEKPADYPANSHYTGFWTLPSEQPLAQDLESFIQAGEPPLLITFGSMPYDSNLDFPKLLHSLSRECNTRIVVVKGWGLTRMDGLEDSRDIKLIDTAPYDKLMPRVKAVVHHGGVGTIASCLQAGKPFLTCPILYPLGDQHFWGWQAVRKGVGLPPVPLKKMTPEKMVHAVRKLLETPSLYQCSQDMMEKLRREDGPAEALRIVESI